MLAALSVQTLKGLPGRICGRSLSSLVHVLLRGRPSFVYMTEIWQQSLSLLYARVQCGPPLRFPFPHGSPLSLFFQSCQDSGPPRTGSKPRKRKIVTSALIVVVVALVGEIVDGVPEVLVLRPKRLAL